MMKWGGRKPSSSSSSSKPSFISQVSPFSWLSKFRHMRINSDSDTKHGKVKQNKNIPSDTSPQLACWNRGRFYEGGDDDAFWRLSFGEEESNDHKKGEDILKPVLQNLDADNVKVIPSSSFPCVRLNAKKHRRREGTLNLKFKQKKDIGLREETKSTKELECLKRRYERKAQRVLQEQLLKLENAAEETDFASSKCKSLEKNDEVQFESPRTICTPRTHLFSSNVDSKCSGLSIGLESIKEAGVLSSNQDSELKEKVNKKRQSVHVSRELQRRKPKVRVHSPRMMGSKVEICKIKAIEDKKKAKLKMKKEEEIMEETEGLDSFAVVKSSLDPQQDFRDSMIEMIIEKQISQPEEMEELLACYLTLNSNEYHDLIIKAFRQVWLYMSQSSFGTKSNKQRC